MRTIVVADHDPAWASMFRTLHDRLWPAVADVATSIEHVGSTAVPGLAAKPIIDLDIVLPTRDALPEVVERLAALGYEHRGTLGVEDRDAFRPPPGPIEHHLYAGPRDGLGIANHLAVRDHLRAHPEAVRVYGDLKQRLAREHPHDIDAYIAGKTNLLLSVLSASGLSRDQLARIEAANR